MPHDHSTPVVAATGKRLIFIVVWLTVPNWGLLAMFEAGSERASKRWDIKMRVTFRLHNEPTALY